MMKFDVHCIEIVPEEYETMFDFYINQLEFQYVKGSLIEVKQRVNELYANGVSFNIIECLKCGKDYILYMDGGLT
ncbi:hypothetical protein BU107_04490 [Staphylococcus xylosus]|uniref:hypothetical protein n=1 Tax=Staphylococcus xylosus TaxID=1288 RepID=UPI000E6900A2|nr:hypothetical protein [Staphylococcus xylosus]RIM88987.1 hypothetical protein BU107_04490 [Staphylococcus xylosus]